VHDALPLAPAVLDSLRIRSKQFGGITPLHGCRILKPVALFFLRGLGDYVSSYFPGWVGRQGVLVADTGNSRILRFPILGPSSTGPNGNYGVDGTDTDDGNFCF